MSPTDAVRGFGAGSEIRLWLDDIRDPREHGRIGWRWAKTYDDAVACFERYVVVEASLDHDLTIQQTIGNNDGEKTGYDVVCWMEERGIWPRDGVHVHSMNPSGAARMRQALAGIKRRAHHEQPNATTGAERSPQEES